MTAPSDSLPTWTPNSIPAPTPPRMHRRWVRRTIITAVTVLCGFLALTVVVGLTTAGHQSTGTATVIPSTSATVSLSGQVAAWRDGGGGTISDQLAADMQAISTDAGRQDVAALQVDAHNLSVTVDRAKAYAPLPDDAAQEAWSSALDHFSEGAVLLSGGLAAGDSTTINAASVAVDEGATDMRTATARITAINAAG